MAPHRQDNRDLEPTDPRAPNAQADMPPSAAMPGNSGPPSPAAAPGMGAATGSQYLQLRVRVEGNALRVVDARMLPGTLIKEHQAGPGWVYEVAVAGRRLAVGSLPDLSVRRSYGDPQGPPERRGHHVTHNPHQEFAVRLGSEDVKRDELAALEVELYEVPAETARTPRAASLRNAGPAVRPIARLTPNWLDSVPQPTREELERALRS